MSTKRLTDEQKKKIIADYVDTGSYSESARMNGISVTGVKKIVDKDEESLRMFNQKKLDNTQSTIEYMNTQHETKKKILDKILKAIEDKADNIDMFTNIKDLATAYGIIVDKELKVLELQRNGDANKEELSKLDELLKGIKDEANKWY